MGFHEQEVWAIGELEPEAGALASIRAVSDAAVALEGHDATAQTEEPQSSTARHALRLLEGGEEPPLHVRGDADARVLHLHAEHLQTIAALLGDLVLAGVHRGGRGTGRRVAGVPHAAADGDGARVRVLDGVGEQAQQVLREPAFVRDDVATYTRRDGLQLHGDAVLNNTHDGDGPLQRREHVHGLEGGQQLDALRALGEVDSPIDGHGHELHGGGDGLRGVCERCQLLRDASGALRTGLAVLMLSD
mmetsp:Transcript_27762/g.38246  ORF Transcript_27762/g.38246 Transcript_27762/m.38246 type:complete len:247 (-) Transcript_27762:810-1550(-)